MLVGSHCGTSMQAGGRACKLLLLPLAVPVLKLPVQHHPTGCPIACALVVWGGCSCCQGLPLPPLLQRDRPSTGHDTARGGRACCVDSRVRSVQWYILHILAVSNT